MAEVLKNIFNIPLSCSFWDCLAEIYLKKCQGNNFELASALFLVPNRRACQALTAAFVRQRGLEPTILPQIIPIAEIDDDELFFNSFGSSDFFLNEKKTISREERLFLFAKMIMSKPNDFGLRQISLAQALNLALDLANFIDTACNQGLSFDKLNDLVPEKYATHWQETLKLLKIITQYWPLILQEREAIDVAELKKRLLFYTADLWRKEHNNRHIIAAGITASFPAIVNMLNVIKDLPNGEIYFAGIDFFADDIYWDMIDESHPQFEIKELLDLLKIDRRQVSNACPPLLPEREKLIFEIMRPAQVSNAWRGLQRTTGLEKAISNIELVECNTQRDEALAIALKLREVLSYPQKTAALVTYDRNLARRVAAELERFEIKIDDSAGLPLNLSAIGIYLRLVAEAAEDMGSQVKLINLMKNPFTLFHTSAAEFRKKVYEYELALRSPRKGENQEAKDFIQNLKEALADFCEALHSPKVEFGLLIEKHIKLAEDLATSSDTPGKAFLWKGDGGKTAAKFITKILEAAKYLGEIAGKDYLALFSELMMLESVRTTYGTHPRLSILGPIEARLHHFDYIILGEVNEGIWPKPAQADMWMSRPMKKDFGFNLPEKNIGILGADLCGFLASEYVTLTRAERVDGVPMKKSRWLLRMETVLKALDLDIESLKNNNLFSLANELDKPLCFNPIKSPAPCPPVSARPRKLSASAVDLLILDPYSVFAKYILRLYRLNDLDTPLDQRDYGTLIHGIIEEFNNLYPAELPQNALEILLDIGKKHFVEQGIDKELEAFWFPKFENTARWLVEQEDGYRELVKQVHNEVSGEICYNLPGGAFTFTAKADRVDLMKDGSLNIVDYKTGKIPSKKQVMSGHAMQLLLEGLIALKGRFAGISNADVTQLIYWQLGSNSLEIPAKEQDILEKSEEYLLKLASTFDFETTPYYSRPVPKFVSKNKDYEHLARIKEWSVQDDGDGNDD
ncbi:MAG: PD-(D/E)XK nuclease family protein [Alphaproteobacteria bacterium]|nr:PD-(D/E)XK nuclease family protein [Alphaproteobacteria bacterium]